MIRPPAGIRWLMKLWPKMSAGVCLILHSVRMVKVLRIQHGHHAVSRYSH